MQNFLGRNNLNLMFLISLLLPLSITAGSLYVRDGGSGNGTSWSDALDDLPSSLTRGDTIWVADGSYSRYSFNDAQDGSKTIVIKKATISEHGTNTGWQDSYGDGQADWTATGGSLWSFTTGYYVFDGTSRSSLNSGHGFKVAQLTGPETNGYAAYVGYGNTANHLTFKYVEFAGAGWNASNRSRLLYSNGTSDYMTVQYCYFHGASLFYLFGGGGSATNLLVEYSYHYRCGSGDAAVHTENMAHATSGNTNCNVIIRYNYWIDQTRVGGTSYLSLGHDANSGGFKIYGNVFYETSPLSGPSEMMGNTGGDTIRDVYIYNNTFVNYQGYNGGIGFDNATNVIVKNNLWYNCGDIGWEGATLHDFNAADVHLLENNSQIIGSGIFSDYANYDFLLSASTEPGDDTIGAEYNKDMFGKTRGADGIWDRGAFEFQTGLSKPKSPENVEIK